ncbi:hypothetical protein [Haloarcula amylovorans]|uniref:hypothetical protein n=1 Tax=Haloarcula amylovorans TaxID=2562280 RepID=UPI00107612F6|nr:hypothetical protein [Halomicroarcula amylolytica]
MKRRSFLAGFGIATGAGALTVGSGAFTSVSARRSITVSVADDFRAFLRLEPIQNEGVAGEPVGRSSTGGRTITFEIPGDGDGENSAAGGVAPDSIYEFHDLVEVVNQGTQPVDLYSTYDGDLANIGLVDKDGVLRNDPATLAVGDSLAVGLHVDTHGASTGEYDETLTIVAEATDD